MTFSWKKAIDRAKKKNIEVHHILAKQGNPDLKTKHPDWFREAQKKNYTAMDKTLNEQFDRRQDEIKRRREKNV